MYANAHSALAAGGKGTSSEPGAAGLMHSCTRPRNSGVSGGSSVSRPTNGSMRLWGARRLRGFERTYAQQLFLRAHGHRARAFSPVRLAGRASL